MEWPSHNHIRSNNFIHDVFQWQNRVELQRCDRARSFQFWWLDGWRLKTILGNSQTCQVRLEPQTCVSRLKAKANITITLKSKSNLLTSCRDQFGRKLKTSFQKFDFLWSSIRFSVPTLTYQTVISKCYLVLFRCCLRKELRAIQKHYITSSENVLKDTTCKPTMCDSPPVDWHTLHTWGM